MQSGDHPLLSKNMQGAIAVVALTTGLGIAMMSFHLLIPGIVLAMLGFVGVVWIYGRDLLSLRLRSAGPDGETIPLSGEVRVVLILLLAAFVAPWTIFVHESWPDKSTNRHLDSSQKERLRANLKLAWDERYDFQINSAPSCDECEQFAEELRDFFGSIPGIQTGGGPLIFSGRYSRGISFITNGKRSMGGGKVFSALQDAGMSPKQETESQMKDGDFIVLIGRP
jgi:hypothetical protein